MKFLITRPYGKPLDKYGIPDQFVEMFDGTVMNIIQLNTSDYDEYDINHFFAILEFNTIEELIDFKNMVNEEIIIDNIGFYEHLTNECDYVITIYDDYIE